MLNQNQAPIYEALEQLKKSYVIPFDVPGHKRGLANEELTAFLGKQCMRIDVNSMKPLDFLCHPVSVIAKAEQLAAEAFCAAHAFFMVSGTSSAVQAMILATCKPKEKILLPRNVHKSVLGALILCGALPVYIECQTHKRLGISLGVTLGDVTDAIEKTPDAKAILINNPTYYGICSDVKGITDVAHKHNMMVLVDEAHGTHFSFLDRLPISAMQAGADFAAVSMHKSGGSLTQSSFLLCGGRVNHNYVRQIINLTQTTSGSYLLLSSLDLSRKHLALRGKEVLSFVCDLASYAREEIGAIGDYYAFSSELINNTSVFDFDMTKLSVNTLDVGLAGVEVYDILRDEYDIQIEFGDIGNLLAYISVGDTPKNVEMLIGALSEIRRRYKKSKAGMLVYEYIAPQVVLPPQEAFYAQKESLPLKDSNGRICAESIMCYPPGIPILSPGECITQDIIDLIVYAKQKGSSLTGAEDMTTEHVNVVC